MVARGRFGLQLFAIACAFSCGGGVESDVSAAGGPLSSASSSSGGTITAPSVSVPSGPCTTQTFFRDRDGDGYGGPETIVACVAPSSDWAAKGGDCNDDDKRVFPGQTTYFDSPYESKISGPSYDYDCSSSEDQSTPLKKVAATCTFLAGACLGAGYVPAYRSSPGARSIDALCGSTLYQDCRHDFTSGPPTCRAEMLNVSEAVGCR